MIHTYGAVDPAGLRRPELGTAGVERREEQPFGVRWRLDLMEKGEGQPRGKTILTSSPIGGCPFSSIYSGRGGEATLEEGAAPRCALGFPSTWWGCPRVFLRGAKALQVEAPPYGPLWSKWLPPHLGLPSERGPIDI